MSPNRLRGVVQVSGTCSRPVSLKKLMSRHAFILLNRSRVNVSVREYEEFVYTLPEPPAREAHECSSGKATVGILAKAESSGLVGQHNMRSLETGHVFLLLLYYGCRGVLGH